MLGVVPELPERHCREVVLGDEGTDARRLDIGRQVLERRGRHQHHDALPAGLAVEPGGGDTVGAAQVQVDQDEMDVVVGQEREGVLAGRSGPGEDESLGRVDHHRGRGSEAVVVVDHQNLDGIVVTHPWTPRLVARIRWFPSSSRMM